jgi:hypothetical protein
LVRNTDFVWHWITPSHAHNQSIPRITSIPHDFRTARLDRKSIPLILRFTHGHKWMAFISPPGELTSNGVFIGPIGMLCFPTN